MHHPTIQNEEGRSKLSGDAIILAEKLLVRLGDRGGSIVLGPISNGCSDRLLIRQLALALQVISARPTLLVCSETSGSVDQHGFTDLLVGATTLQQVLATSKGQELASIGYGTLSERAPELVISEAFRAFIKTALLQFHWILFHCSHLLDQRLAASLIARSDGVIATLERGRGQASEVRAIRDLCAHLNRPFAGVILI
jgi:hypothetical protein